MGFILIERNPDAKEQNKIIVYDTTISDRKSVVISSVCENEVKEKVYWKC